ncbi:hypothetical protein BSQ97_24420, partial [Serratia proteamaculans]
MALTDSQSTKLSATIAENAAAEAKSYADLASKSEDFSNKAEASAEAAAASEMSSEESATSAMLSASNAADSEATAAISAQNATLASNVYPTVPAAQEAITAGTIPLDALFNIASSIDTSYVDQYTNTAGVATPTGKQYPSKLYIDLLTDEIGIVSDSNAQLLPGFTGVAEMSADKNGSVTYRRLDDGTTQFPAMMVGANVEQVQTYNGSVFQSRASGQLVFGLDDSGSVKMLSLQAFMSSEYPDYSEVHADVNGRIFKIVHTNGTVEDVRDSDNSSSFPIVSAGGGMAVEVSGVIKFISTAGENSALTSDAGNLNPVTFLGTDGSYFVKFASQEGRSGDYQLHRIAADGSSRIRQGNSTLIHINIIGQSLSVGGSPTGLPAVTVTPSDPYGAVTFNGGPKFDSAYPAKAVATTDLEYLVPIAENFGKASMQESDCSGLSVRFHEGTGATCLMSATGASGTAIAGISSGTDSFNAAKLVMQRGYEIATSLGMNYHPYMLFIHGNADAVAGTAAATYKSAMLALRSDYETYLRTLMGSGEFNLTMFVQQFSNASVQAGATGADANLIIGNAQYEVCRDNPNFILTGTQYARLYVDRDHLNNYGYRTDGEVVGLSVARYHSN